jgi:hypothetical protein
MVEIDYSQVIRELRDKNIYKEQCKQEKDLVKQCLGCKKYLSSSEWDMILESRIKRDFNISKSADPTSGDGVSQGGLNIEIKVSLGGNCRNSGQTNFVQLRPDHDIDYYLFLVYDQDDGSEFGSVKWFLCPSSELYDLLPEFGGYAHGSIDEYDKIKENNIRGKNREFCLRPNSKSSVGTKPRRLWDIMVSKFSVTEEQIIKTLS